MRAGRYLEIVLSGHFEALLLSILRGLGNGQYDLHFSEKRRAVAVGIGFHQSSDDLAVLMELAHTVSSQC